MKAKSVLYAAVGAPVVAARKVGARANNIGTKLTTQAGEYGDNFEKAFDHWAEEGEKVVGRISEGKVVDELTSKVDLEQAKEQVTKLRDQLEDMLSTWRSSFRPEKTDAEAPATKTATAKTPAKKPAAKASAAKTSAAKTTKSPAAKTSSETDKTPEVEQAS
jgi:hypothetical protein